MNPTDPSVNPPPAPLEAPDDFKAMMLAATLIFVLSLIPYVSLLGACCLPQIGGALLAVHLYTNWYRLTLTPGQGIKLGILTVLLGGLASFTTVIALQLLFGYQPNVKEIQGMMLKLFSHSSPEVVEKLKEAFENQRAQGVTLFQVLIGLVATAVTAGISGLIGGAIGSAIFKRGASTPASNH